jgi:hypothetical protein
MIVLQNLKFQSLWVLPPSLIRNTEFRNRIQNYALFIFLVRTAHFLRFRIFKNQQNSLIALQ